MIIPLYLFPALIETLRVGPTGDLAFICGANGKPMTRESFGNAFHDACRAARIKKSARKLAATTGSRIASHYTQAFERKRAAREGFKKLVLNDERTSIPAPDQKGAGARTKIDAQSKR